MVDVIAGFISLSVASLGTNWAAVGRLEAVFNAWMAKHVAASDQFWFDHRNRAYLTFCDLQETLSFFFKNLVDCLESQCVLGYLLLDILSRCEFRVSSGYQKGSDVHCNYNLS